MGSALFIIVDLPSPDFSTEVNGKSIAQAMERLDEAATQLGLTPLTSFVSISRAEAESLLGEADEPQPELVARLGVKREPDFLYFVEETKVQRVRRKRPGKPAAEPETIAELQTPADPDWIYVVDEDGDVVRTPRPGTTSMPPPDDVEWFAPAAALATIRALQTQPLAGSVQYLAEDLARFSQVLEEAARRGMRFRFAVDF